MRSQTPNIDQAPGSSEQKKSVFDRLGCQVGTGRSMKRRPSPGQHGEWMPPPPVHDIDFTRYGREPHPQNELDWRYQHERRHIPPFPGERHPLQLAPPPPPQSHYEMDMAGRQNPYYPHPQHMYHNGPPGPPPPIGMINVPMNIHQQRSSPKYDRHGNVIMSFKERSGPIRLGPMDQYHGMSPPRTFMPGPMMGMPQGNQHDMIPSRANAMYPPQRWHGTPEEEFTAHSNPRLVQEDRYSPISSRRQQQHHHHQQQQPHLLNSTITASGQVGEFPRYTKWRERRDVITTLDRETTQSSSRTDSLKSSLQQPENRVAVKIETAGLDYAKGTSPVIKNSAISTQKDLATNDRKISEGSEKESSTRDSIKSKHSVKTEPQEISDGEIIDDEDSSDDSEVVKTSSGRSDNSNKHEFSDPPKNLHTSYGRTRESQYFESGKKRRLHERDEYSMDYETISDEDLDIFMGDKKMSDFTSADAKLGSRLNDEEGKSLSEIELLNALGLDWANLVEMAKQSKTSGKDSYALGSSTPRFSMQNYLPTLGISPDLVGSEIYDLVLKVSRGT